MAHHLVVIAQFARDNGLSLTKTMQCIGDNYDDLPEEIVRDRKSVV